MRRLASWLLDSGPVLVLALIAGAGSFTHIRDTAIEHGQTGPMAWAVAVCVDLTCVMAARERQRDKRTGRQRNGGISWPTLVLVGGVVLFLAANLAQAEASPWGWITAATPAGAFLIAVSMLERRTSAARSFPAPASTPETVSEPAATPTPVPARRDGPATELLVYARRVAEEYQITHDRPINHDTLRARLGVSHQLASDLLRHLRIAPDAL